MCRMYCINTIYHVYSAKNIILYVSDRTSLNLMFVMRIFFVAVAF